MNEQERQTLADFLKSRRSRLQPSDVGLIRGGVRRRTPGLRREEVATLAGISVTWYTWIEQARDIRISEDVIRNLADALRLQPHECHYLYTLCGLQPGEQKPIDATQLTSTLRQLINHQGIFPAYVMGRYWQVLYKNAAATKLFVGLDDLQGDQHNMLWYTFAHQQARQLVVNWEDRAHRLVAEFRADCGTAMDDVWLQAFVGRLKGVSNEFETWWNQHDVNVRDGGRRDFNHPQVGPLMLEQTTLRLSQHPEIKIVIHVPLNEMHSEHKLRLLASD